MTKVSLFTLISISVLLTACAGQPKDGATNVASTSGKICRYEKTTGSHLGTKICRTPAQIEHEQKIAQETMRNQGKGGISNGSGG